MLFLDWLVSLLVIYALDICDPLSTVFGALAYLNFSGSAID